MYVYQSAESLAEHIGVVVGVLVEMKYGGAVHPRGRGHFHIYMTWGGGGGGRKFRSQKFRGRKFEASTMA